MAFFREIGVKKFGEYSKMRVRLLTLKLQLSICGIYYSIIIIRLLQSTVGNGISS
jgi:hypothetical protein